MMSFRHLARRRPPVLHALAMFSILITGCHPAMSKPSTGQMMTPPPETLVVPLRFKKHNFEAVCYSTIGCRVLYNGRYQRNDAPDKRSRPPPSVDYLQTALGSVEIGIRDFPPPAEVFWKSLDGVAHNAKVDVAAIFKDELTWHRVPKSDMADFFRGPVAGAPNIYLEVKDRTINVYITMLVPTRTEQVPGNKYSYMRDDVFLAWTKTL